MITVVINTNNFQKGDFSKHKSFNPLIHKVYNNIEEWRKSNDYPKSNLITPFSKEEIDVLKNPDSYCNNDNNWK